LGLFNGNVTIRDRLGIEKANIKRPNAGPAWSVMWNPNANGKTDTLAVADWSQRLSFYMLSGRQVSTV
jgi:intraflagellar transport protein 122